MRTRYALWHAAALVLGFAFVAGLLTLSRLCFPALVGIVECFATGNVAEGSAAAFIMTLFAGTGLLGLMLMRMAAEGSVARARAIRDAPRAISIRS